VAGRAGDAPGAVVHGEIVTVEPAGHGRAQRHGLDDQVVTGGPQVGPDLA
jgi:hypothetical protein